MKFRFYRILAKVCRNLSGWFGNAADYLTLCPDCGDNALTSTGCKNAILYKKVIEARRAIIKNGGHVSADITSDIAMMKSVIESDAKKAKIKAKIRQDAKFLSDVLDGVGDVSHSDEVSFGGSGGSSYTDGLHGLRPTTFKSGLSKEECEVIRQNINTTQVDATGIKTVQIRKKIVPLTGENEYETYTVDAYGRESAKVPVDMPITTQETQDAGDKPARKKEFKKIRVV